MTLWAALAVYSEMYRAGVSYKKWYTVPVFVVPAGSRVPDWASLLKTDTSVLVCRLTRMD